MLRTFLQPGYGYYFSINIYYNNNIVYYFIIIGIKLMFDNYFDFDKMSAYGR